MKSGYAIKKEKKNRKWGCKKKKKLNNLTSAIMERNRRGEVRRKTKQYKIL